MTPDISVVFKGDGSAALTINGETSTLHGETPLALRAEVVSRAAKLAKYHSQTVRLRVLEDGVTTLVDVRPDGSNAVVPPPSEPLPEPEPEPIEDTQPQQPATPQPEAAGRRSLKEAMQAKMGAAPAPQPVEDPQDQPDVPPQEYTREPAKPVAQPVVPAEAPAPQPEPEPFRYDDHPEWQDERKRPAAEGWRSLLRLPASKEEMTQRQRAFTERMAQEAEQARLDAERRAAEEQRQAEENSRRQAREQERAAHLAKLNRKIQTNYQGTRTILVANPKGGARKTTTTYLLGAMIGSTRGGSTIAWDANETMGTLGERAQSDRHHRTVVDLLEDGAQHFLDIDSARVGVLDAYVRNQGDAHFDVLASDENPARQDQIDAEGFRKVHDILSHFYRMILVDTGNNIRAAHFTEAQRHADQLVIPVAASHDSKNRALDMMAAFSAAGHDNLVASAVVLVHELEPIERADDGTALSNQQHELTAAEIAEAFEGRVRTVLPVPYDPTLKDGGQIDFFQVQAPTVSAYREAAAAISDALIDRTLQPGRHGGHP